MQKNKTYKKKQDNNVNKNNVREYRQRKRRVMIKESDDNATLRA